MKHVHCDLIKAWADGAQIQVFSDVYQGWRDTTSPSWFITTMYRLKPKVIKQQFRAALFRPQFVGDNRIAMAMSPDVEQDNDFIRWIDPEWRVIEVEE